MVVIRNMPSTTKRTKRCIIYAPPASMVSACPEPIEQVEVTETSTVIAEVAVEAPKEVSKPIVPKNASNPKVRSWTWSPLVCITELIASISAEIKHLSPAQRCSCYVMHVLAVHRPFIADMKQCPSTASLVSLAKRSTSLLSALKALTGNVYSGLRDLPSDTALTVMSNEAPIIAIRSTPASVLIIDSVSKSKDTIRAWEVTHRGVNQKTLSLKEYKDMIFTQVLCPVPA